MDKPQAPTAQNEVPRRAMQKDVDYELLVSSLGDTVWLNAADGSCIGRFSKRFGMDVHNSASAQMDGAPECLFCTHAVAGKTEWEKFREVVKANYGIHLNSELLQFSSE